MSSTDAWNVSWDLDDPEAIPYFNWDAPVTNRQVRAALATGTEEERLFWIARILREARVPDVWRYLSLSQDILPNWRYLAHHRLGRRERLWRYLIEGWRADGFI